MAEAAAKEPTMEDILASIRKIISQDDARGRATPPQPAPAAPRPAAPASAAAGNSFVDRMAQSSSPAAAQPPAGKVSSLAALASQVKSQMPRTSEGFRPASAAAPQPRPEPRVEPRPAAPVAAAPRVEPVRAAAPAPQPAPAAPAMRQAPEPVRPAPQPASAIVAAGPRPAPEPAPRPAPAAVAPQRQEAEVHAFRDALVSPSTENAVNSSVERLRKALSDGADAKFEAVLRPMLREWMDENLPRMVERVVREEIDRIVRQG